MTEKEEKQARHIMRLGQEIIRLQEENIELNYRIIELLALREDCPYTISRFEDSCTLAYKKDSNLRRFNNIPVIRRLLEKEMFKTTLEDKLKEK